MLCGLAILGRQVAFRVRQDFATYVIVNNALARFIISVRVKKPAASLWAIRPANSYLSARLLGYASGAFTADTLIWCSNQWNTLARFP
jgi:hypothetical protein